LQKSFLRDNLSYVVRKAENKLETLIYILHKVPGSAIVYVRNRRRTKEIAVELIENGISADFFHAGLNREEKTKRQDRWKSGECRVIVATNAFGMGIDKPDVRLVVHIDMPGSLEEYYQEAGRAGRDGKPAYAVALYGGSDKQVLAKRARDEYPDKAFISRVYEALGNFFQIAVGFGLESIHDFSLAEFCMAYKFPLLPAHHALKILELAGYIEYTEEADNASRLMFVVTREDLYKYLREDARTDEIVQTVLRLYTGLFSDYAFIDESRIATRSGYPAGQVYETLVALSKRHILNYIPHKRTPLIVYARSREDLKYLVIPRSAYEERKERFEKRLKKVLAYLENEEECRSRMLLSYFGEKQTHACGHCDVCLSKRSSGLEESEFEAIRQALLEMLSSEPAEVRRIVDFLPFPEGKIRATIRFLSEHDARFCLSDGRLSCRH
jgi:ATP-dependent DNA helicase RecQ